MIGQIAAWTGGALFLLLALLLFVPVHMLLGYHTGGMPGVRFRWLIFHYDFSEETIETRKKRRKGPRKKRASKAPSKAPKKPTSPKTPEAFSEKLAAGVRLLEAAKGPLGRLVRRFRFYKVALTIVVSKEDAAQTGLAYGQVSWLVSSAYGLAKTFLNLAKPSIHLRPEFETGREEINCDIRGRLRLIWVLWAGLRFLFEFIKRTHEAGTEVSAEQKP